MQRLVRHPLAVNKGSQGGHGWGQHSQGDSPGCIVPAAQRKQLGATPARVQGSRSRPWLCCL